LDSINAVVAVLAAGAAAGLKDDVAQAVRDAYSGIKAWLHAHYPKVDLWPLEERPASSAKQASLAEDLTNAGASNDDELLRLADVLFTTIHQDAPQAATSIGVDLEDVRGAFLIIRNVRAGSVGVRVRSVEVTDGIEISGIDAGGGPNPNL
jgi:hypothetical protein